jgi:hypothetical protein
MRRVLASVLVSACALAAAALLQGARPARASAASSGFLATPTDQIAVPGLAAGGEVTPEGDLYSGWAEYELRFGRRLLAWNQPTRTLPDSALPLLSSTLSDGAVRYTQTMFAVAVAGRPVVYDTVTVSNTSSRPTEAEVEMAVAYTRGRQIRGIHGVTTGAFRYERPVGGQPDGYFEQPGQAFSGAFAYGTAGRDLLRSGLLLARGPALPNRALAAPRANTPTTPHDARLFVLRLEARGHASLTWQIPLDPPAPGAGADRALDAVPLDRAHAELVGTWHALQTGTMGIDVPEAKVLATYRAAIVDLLASRFETPSGSVQSPNRLQYRAFWIRDGAIEAQALDLAGLHAQAAQDLAFLDTFQRADGLFISRSGQYDGFGQALWALDRHARLAGDPVYASAQLARIGAAIDWLSAATASDPIGLLPAGNPGDDELAQGHITGDDLWAAAGLRAAIDDATLAGRGDLAGAWRVVDGRFEASLHRAIDRAVARAGHIPPVLDAPGGQDWGNYSAAFPAQVLKPTSAAVRATMAWARAHIAEGLATYRGGRLLHDYLGFAVFQTELAAGEAPRAIAGLYAELVHTTSTDAGWETDIAPFGDRSTATNLSPHGTFAADYVALLRNMLVADDAGSVELLRGASPAWLAPGQHIAVTGAPTEEGVVSFSERSSAHGESLTWRSSLAPGTPLLWVLPRWAAHAHTSDGRAVGSTVSLPGGSGSIAVTFDGRRPAQSYALAAAALDAAYRARGRAAPLAP